MSGLLLIFGFLVSGETRRADKPTPLILEQNTTLRVGELAVLEIPSDLRSSRFHGNTGAGNALMVVRHSGYTTLYRAVRPGEQTILIGPADVLRGECISCRTLHYFVTVAAQE